MARLLVNPGTPQEWEIQLRPGPNRIGRSDDNDFTVPHGSVSSSHCEVILTEVGVVLRDLGSTNGTFVNRAPVKETNLQPGQRLQLGAVDMLFVTDAPTAAAVIPTPIPTAATPAPAPAAPAPAIRINISKPAPAAPASEVPAIPPPAPPPVPARPAGLRIAGAAHTQAAPPPAAEETEAPPEMDPPMAPPVSGVAGVLNVGSAFCKFHPKTPARFYCNKCHKYFCDMCVATRAGATGQMKTCRACGVPVAAVQVNVSRPESRGFFGQLLGAFVYPFRGFGVVILLFTSLVFGGVDYAVSIGFLSGPFGWVIRAAFYGLLFLFMQNIIHTTTSDEKEPLGFPEPDGLFGAAFQLAATIFLCFGLAIGLLVAKLMDVDVPIAAIIGTVVLGCFYFPMAFLAVAMKDSVMAANPLVVVPSILKIPLEYLVTTIMLMAVFGLRGLGSLLSGVAGSATLRTSDMSVLFISLGVQAAWAIGSIYLLTVNMRMLGLLYNAKKDKLEWF